MNPTMKIFGLKNMMIFLLNLIIIEATFQDCVKTTPECVTNTNFGFSVENIDKNIDKSMFCEELENLMERTPLKCYGKEGKSIRCSDCISLHFLQKNSWERHNKHINEAINKHYKSLIRDHRFYSTHYQ